MKNIDIVSSVISKKLNIDYKIVEKVNKYYWKKGVIKKISTLESGAIFVKGLLTFTSSRYNIKKEIKKTIDIIRNIKNSKKFTEEKKIIIIEELRNKLKILLIERNNIAKLIYERDNRIHSINSKSIKK